MALTIAAPITAEFVDDDSFDADTIILNAMVAEWTDGEDELARQIAFELRLDLLFGSDETTLDHRRPNPRARSMRRNGRKYAIRKDRHTKAFYLEIAAIKAEIEANKRSDGSVRSRRKARKHEERSGHPRYRTSRS